MVKIPAPLSSDRDRDVVRCDGLLFFGGLLDGNGLTKLFMVRMLKDHCENKFKKNLKLRCKNEDLVFFFSATVPVQRCVGSQVVFNIMILVINLVTFLCHASGLARPVLVYRLNQWQ